MNEIGPSDDPAKRGAEARLIDDLLDLTRISKASFG